MNPFRTFPVPPHAECIKFDSVRGFTQGQLPPIATLSDRSCAVKVAAGKIIEIPRSIYRLVISVSAMTFSVRQLVNPADGILDETADALAKAFGYSYFLSALGGKRELVVPFLRAHLNAAIMEGEVYVVEVPEDGIVGGAIWFGPQQKFLSTPEQRAAGWDDIMNKIEPKFKQFWDQFLLEYDDLCEKCFGPGVKLASYHLQVFGVTPDYQRRGFGRALIEAVATKAKPRGDTLVLETMGEKNVGIYKAMSFEVAGSGAVKGVNDSEWVFICLKRSTKPDA